MLAATAALDVTLRDVSDPSVRNRLRVEQLQRSLEDMRGSEALDREGYRQTGAALRAALFSTPEAVTDTRAELDAVAADPDFRLRPSADDLAIAERLDDAMRAAHTSHDAEVRARPALRGPTGVTGTAEAPLPEDERAFH